MFVALHKIIMGSGKKAVAVLPGEVFAPDDADIQFLKDSKSIRPATDAEVALFEKTNGTKKAKPASAPAAAKTETVIPAPKPAPAAAPDPLA